MASADFLGGVAADDGRGWYALHDDAPRGGNRIGLHLHATKQRRSRTNPSTGMHDYRFRQQIESRRAVIVAAGAEISVLRNADMTADGDIFDIVDPHVLTDPAMIANREPPGVFDADVWFEVNAMTDLRTEQTEQSRLEPTRGKPTAFQEQQTAIVPQCAHQQSATRIVLRVFERAKIAQGAIRVGERTLVGHVFS